MSRRSPGSEDETHPKKQLLYFLQDGHNATHFYQYHYYYYITLARFLSASIAV